MHATGNNVSQSSRDKIKNSKTMNGEDTVLLMSQRYLHFWSYKGWPIEGMVYIDITEP